MVVPKCSFSQKEIEKGKGIMFVKKDGTIYYFESSQEKKNMLGLKREGRRQKWTPASREFKKGQAKKGSKKKVK